MSGDDDAKLVEWLKKADWSALIADPDIKKNILLIKERADALTGATGGDDVDIANATRIKLVVVGDGAVGKTSLLISYATGDFPTEYVPTVFENYTAQLELNNATILLHLWDTAGQEDYDRLRPLSYPGSDIVFLCFSVVNKTSYDAIKIKWFPEVHHYVPSVPIMLLGTKLDLREEGVADPQVGSVQSISTEEGEELSKEIKAIKYFEVSAKTRKNLDSVFQEAVNHVFEMRERSGSSKEGANTGNSNTTSNNNNNNQTNNNNNSGARKNPKKDPKCILF